MDRLLTFEEVLNMTEHHTRNLLLGNGFSMAFDKDRFSFTNLLQSAVENKIIEKDSEIYNIFKSLGTSDFENVIKLLESSSDVLSIYDPKETTNSIIEKYHKNTSDKYNITYYNNLNIIVEKLKSDADALKKHLVDVITNNHPDNAAKIPEEEYLNCINFIKRFDRIFTINYDLLLFWALMKFNEIENEGKFIADKNYRLKVSDGFGNSEFGLNDTYVIYKNNDSTFHQTIHYLHGALHIFDKQSDIIKNTYSRTDKTLKQQTLENLYKSIYPVFISEGTTNKKKAKITHNPYLNNSLKTLRTLDFNDRKFKNENSIIIFGTILKSNDEHIVQAIVESKVKNIFIGISDISKKTELSFFEAELLNKKIALQFYDYKTVKIWR